MRDQILIKVQNASGKFNVHTNGHSPILKNNYAYKDKWDIICGDFKHIFNYMFSIGNNTKYWDFIPK